MNEPETPNRVESTDLSGAVVESGGCLGVPTAGNQHAEMDAYGKANGLTVVFAPWHPNPEYRIFKTDSLLSHNEEYPSGLVIVNERGVPQPWQAPNGQSSATAATKRPD